MQEWGKRPIEVASLFNPAFCSVIIRESIKGFQSEQTEGMSYSIVHLILPIVLHKATREQLPISITTKMHSWINQNRELKIQFAERVRNLNSITKEGLIYGLQTELFLIDSQGRFKLTSKKIKPNWKAESEPFICSKKAGFIGRWLAQAGDSKTIFHMWGVKP